MYLDDEEATGAAASAEWDVIVVGAGAVGLVLSISLARAGRRVLVLESGSKDGVDARDLNDAEITGRAHLGALHGRARTVGGTTTLWGGQLTRFVPYDFDAREITADSRWPLRYEDLEQYYAEAAAMLDLDIDHLADDTVRRASGASTLGDGLDCEIFYSRWLREPNLARSFAADLAALPGLSVAPRCHATQILCDSGGTRVSGIRAVSSGGAVHVFKARDTVLACGTIENSRLLLLTAAKTPELTWARNQNIGRYFQDHLDLVVGTLKVNDKRALSNLFENIVIDGHKYQPKIRVRTAAQRRLGCLNTACTLRFDSAIGEDLQMMKQFVRAILTGSKINQPWKTLKRLVSMAHIWFPLIWRYLRHRRILAIADRGISVIAHCEQRPMKDSRITLDPSRKDRFGDAIPRLHWLIDEPLQLRSLRVFIGQLETFLRGACDAGFVAAEGLSDDAAVLGRAADSYHQCGGARMAPDEEHGVVDSDCRVFGTANLYVAGAAVFPSSSFANPTFTAMALACRLSGHLQRVRVN
jgi:choline dehydrogenase-like flavoprotein